MSVYRTDQTLVCFLIMVMTGAEVQETISPECKQFLYMGTPPRGLEEQPLKKICQFYTGKPRFVTLYDTINHIPVYSAYTFKRSDGAKKVDVPWMYEPQVGMHLIICLISLGRSDRKCYFVSNSANVNPNSSPRCPAPETWSSSLLFTSIRALRTPRLFLTTTLTR